MKKYLIQICSLFVFVCYSNLCLSQEGGAFNGADCVIIGGGNIESMSTYPFTGKYDMIKLESTVSPEDDYDYINAQIYIDGSDFNVGSVSLANVDNNNNVIFQINIDVDSYCRGALDGEIVPINLVGIFSTTLLCLNDTENTNILSHTVQCP